MNIGHSIRYGLFVFVLFAFFGFLGCQLNSDTGGNNKNQNTATPTSAAKKTFESSAYGVKMEFPADWESELLSAPSVVAFITPFDGDEDIFADNINLVTEDLTGKDTTLTEYSEAALKNIETFVPDMKQVSYTTTTLAGQPAQKIIYTGSSQDTPLQWMQVWSIIGEKAYVFTYTAEPNLFNTFLPDVEDILTSFQLN